jgi:hypothetical protein
MRAFQAHLSQFPCPAVASVFIQRMKEDARLFQRLQSLHPTLLPSPPTPSDPISLDSSLLRLQSCAAHLAHTVTASLPGLDELNARALGLASIDGALQPVATAHRGIGEVCVDVADGLSARIGVLRDAVRARVAEAVFVAIEDDQRAGSSPAVRVVRRAYERAEERRAEEMRQGRIRGLSPDELAAVMAGQQLERRRFLAELIDPSGAFIGILGRPLGGPIAEVASAFSVEDGDVQGLTNRYLPAMVTLCRFAEGLRQLLAAIIAHAPGAVFHGYLGGAMSVMGLLEGFSVSLHLLSEQTTMYLDFFARILESSPVLRSGGPGGRDWDPSGLRADASQLHFDQAGGAADPGGASSGLTPELASLSTHPETIRVQIPSGAKHVHPFVVREPCIVHWALSVTPSDLSFCVAKEKTTTYYADGAKQTETELVPLHPWSRHRNTHQGNAFIDAPGNYALQFDNSFSILTAKNLLYRTWGV